MMAEARVPKKLLPHYEEITGMTDAFCREHLNEEYADGGRDTAATILLPI